MALLSVTFLLGGCSTTNDLQSIAITPPTGTQVLSAVGQTAQFKAIGTFIQGQRPSTTQDITTTVTWTSHNTAVATVSPTGVVSAVGTGNAIITATLSDAKNVITGSSDVTVNLPAPPPPPAALTSIAIIPAAGIQILTAVGQSAQYRAIGTFTQGGVTTATQDVTSIVTWSSQNTAVATVNAAGVVSAAGAGKATISAIYNSTTTVVTGISDVTVSLTPPVVLASIAVLPAAGSQVLTVAGQTTQYRAIGTFTQNGAITATQDITNSVTWSSQNTSVATVNPTGGVSAMGTGKTTISATLSDTKSVVIGTSDVTVTLPAPVPPPVLASVAIIPTAGAQVLTAAGQTVQYKAIGAFTQTGLPTTTQDITSTVAWSSQNTSVATINNAGVVSAVANGTAPISAIFSGSSIVTGTSDVTVAIPPLASLTSITVLPATGTQILTATGQTAQFRAIGTFTQGGLSPTTQDVTSNVIWSSQNTSVATISVAGVVSAASTGTAAISATYNSPTSVITGVSDVTVNLPPAEVLTSITILPGTQQTTAIGETAQFLAIGSYSGTPATLDLTGVVKWAASDISVATINASGLATTTGGGETSITAELTSGAGAAIAATPATLISSTGGSPIAFPTVTLYKLGTNALQGAVTATYMSSTGTILTAINCLSSVSSCSGDFPVGVAITFTMQDTVPEPAFGGWTSNCAPVYSTSPTLSSPGVLATPYACIFNTMADNTAIGVIFN